MAGLPLRPLIERKQNLLRQIERRKGRVLYVDHLLERGKGLYEVAFQWDLEGIVAKRKDSRYVVSRSKPWLKIKNPDYSQADGRQELFESWRSCSQSRSYRNSKYRHPLKRR